MWIAGYHHRHDSSITLLKDGEVVLYTEEERFSGIRHDKVAKSIKTICSKYTDNLDYVGTWWSNNKTNGADLLKDIPSITSNTKHISLNDHHKMHASVAFYNSGFDEAVCVVADGCGLILSNGYEEKESIYHASYPAEFNIIWKNYNKEKPIQFTEFGTNYKLAKNAAGFATKGQHGKFMGLTSYSNKRLPFNDLKSDIINKIPNYKEDFQGSADYANTVQEYMQEQMLELINYAIEKSGCKNVCLSGGFMLNVRANYYYRKHLPKDVNLYCEPLCYDGGLSMGVAKYIHHKITGDMTIRKHENLFYGNYR